MIKLIIGKKGSGKTKKLIDAVLKAVEASEGHVVCVEKGPSLTYDLPHKVRLINTEEYGILGYDMFYGLISGICAGNYDVTHLFIDATLRIGDRNLENFADFIQKINDLANKCEAEIVFTVSCDESELPKRVFDIVEKY
ncbi:MAG: hypothetical protein Q4B04_00130 [bacterium]|nr:hypothetical protein [bacterium]